VSKTILFVYGTLKQGGRSNHLLKEQKFLGEAQTLPRYRLYNQGDHPCLVEDVKCGVAVRGELWQVDETILARLDAYEDPSLFKRCQIDIAGQSASVLAYLYQRDISSLQECGTSWPRNATDGPAL